MRVEERFWAKVDKSDGCWVWTAGDQVLPGRRGGQGRDRHGGRTGAGAAVVARPAGPADADAWQLHGANLSSIMARIERSDLRARR